MKLDLITNKAKLEGNINPNDEFYTPVYAIKPLIKFLKEGSTIWCPFDTDDSNFVKVFKEHGFNVINTHIFNGDNFFDMEVPPCDYIISNPPYSLKGEILNRLFNIGKPFAMLIGIVGIFESKFRFEMFKNNQFELLMFDKRISYFKDYSEQKTSLNPPFSSSFICSKILPQQIVFENIIKN